MYNKKVTKYLELIENILSVTEVFSENLSDMTIAKMVESSIINYIITI